MPFTKDFSLNELQDSLTYWYKKTKSKITYEYVVWKGINDSKADINALIQYCQVLPSKVNLIESNSIGDDNYVGASNKSILLYQEELEKNNITVTVRRSRGQDIDAACGQLANKEVSIN